MPAARAASANRVAQTFRFASLSRSADGPCCMTITSQPPWASSAGAMPAFQWSSRL